ncbi:hypothetical protein [Streptomyces cavernicola]|uniref:1,3-beta-glucanase n=1 Tax=Streptomyces cavernicola TaxID=3043613 RepID=A0ABT6SBJ7_9ACTN|nr:hypothetical protein [Streptomyces sp. B-S-A6]MDI3405571.1 hypothetical protein [Streptomyces sp. B-S-A6]
MSMQLRRLAAVSLMALALAAGSASAASAAAAFPEPGVPGYSVQDESPLHFGPFDLPSSGTISGGMSWDMRD